MVRVIRSEFPPALELTLKVIFVLGLNELADSCFVSAAASDSAASVAAALVSAALWAGWLLPPHPASMETTMVPVNKAPANLLFIVIPSLE